MQFSLDRNMMLTQGRRTTCGVLSCIERSYDGTSTTSGPHLNYDNRYSSPVRTITKMAIYKTERDVSDIHGDNSKPILVASVHSQQPRVSRVANAIKVDGHLEPSITTMTLELFKKQDCRAEFTCEVFALDAKGRELVRTSHLLQQPSSSALDTAGEEGWTPAVAMYLVNLVQDLSTNMELMRNKMDDYGHRWSGFEDKVAKLQKDVTSSIATLEKKINDDFRNLENRMEDKMGLLEDNFPRLNSTSASNGEKSNDNNITLLASSIETAIEKNSEFLLQEIKNLDVLLKEHLEMSFFKPIANATEYLESSFKGDLNHFEDRIEGRFLELASSIHERAVETQSSFHETVNGMNITNADEVASAIKDILTPKTCKRGIISLQTQPSYPYPVIKPSTGDSLTVPYLCDTITDGGGWIIIQRRTTGNVDFYRNWGEYKRGFGTLDDDFWLGNDNIHAITSSGQYELRIDLRYKGKSAYAYYDTFAIADDLNNFSITLGSYHGTAGDALSSHNGQPFTTFNWDNDSHSGNCAVKFHGAWWYTSCHNSNLNGKWKAGQNKGPRWSTLSSENAVSFSEMKIRKKG